MWHGRLGPDFLADWKLWPQIQYGPQLKRITQLRCALKGCWGLCHRCWPSPASGGAERLGIAGVDALPAERIVEVIGERRLNQPAFAVSVGDHDSTLLRSAARDYT
jgi:hypothetical protein